MRWKNFIVWLVGLCLLFLLAVGNRWLLQVSREIVQLEREREALHLRIQELRAQEAALARADRILSEARKLGLEPHHGGFQTLALHPPRGRGVSPDALTPLLAFLFAGGK